MDEKKSDDNQKDSYSQPKNDQAPTARNSEVGPCPDHPPANKENSQCKSKQKTTEAARPHWGLTWSQWLNLVFTAVIAVAAVLYTISAFRQLDVLSKQSKALEGTLMETQEIVRATKDGANAAMRSADAAEKAVEATINSIRLEQRAWVGVKHMRWRREFKKGEKLEAVISVENTGRTPALDVIVKKGSGTVYPTKKILSRPVRGETALIVIAPNNSFASLRTVSEGLTETDIRLLKSGERSVYVYGTITYLDIFKRTHKTGFCGFYTEDAFPALEFCRTMNYME